MTWNHDSEPFTMAVPLQHLQNVVAPMYSTFESLTMAVLLPTHHPSIIKSVSLGQMSKISVNNPVI